MSYIDLPLKLYNYGLSSPLENWDTRLICHFCSYNVAKNEAHFMLECPFYFPIKDKFPSLYKNEVLQCLESFFQLWTIKWILASISQRLPHSTTLVNYAHWNHHDVPLVSLAFSTSLEINFICNCSTQNETYIVCKVEVNANKYSHWVNGLHILHCLSQQVHLILIHETCNYFTRFKISEGWIFTILISWIHAHLLHISNIICI